MHSSIYPVSFMICKYGLSKIFEIPLQMDSLAKG